MKLLFRCPYTRVKMLNVGARQDYGPRINTDEHGFLPEVIRIRKSLDYEPSTPFTGSALLSLTELHTALCSQMIDMPSKCIIISVIVWPGRISI